VARGRLGAHELVNAVLAVLHAVAALRMRHEAAVEALELAVVETSTRAVVAVGLRTGDEKSGDDRNEHSLHGFSFGVFCIFGVKVLMGKTGDTFLSNFASSPSFSQKSQIKENLNAQAT